MAEFNVEDRTVFHGDNLDFLRGINSNSVDCIYIDPPFNKDIIFHSPSESKKVQIEQFEDIWRKPQTTEKMREHIRDRLAVHEQDEELSQWLDGVKLIDQDEQEQNYNYLVFMSARILECHRILKPTGSFFLHCDDTMSHFLKITLDCIFDEPNFRNEIVWQRTRNPKRNKHASKANSRMTDKIFWFTKTNNFTFNGSHYYPSEEELKNEYRFVCEKTNRRYKDNSKSLYRSPSQGDCPSLCFDFHGFKPRSRAGWRTNRAGMEQWLKEGILVIEEVKGVRKLRRRQFLTEQYKKKTLGDLWTDIYLEGKDKSRLNFRTQKPVKLIERIIESATNTGDIVVDVFAGSATTAEAAHNLGRKWAIADKAAETSRYAEKRLGIHVPVIRTNEPPERTDGGEGGGNQRYVYVIEDITDPDWRKVGIAKDVDARLASLQTGRRDRESIRVVHKEYTHLYRELEKYCHDKFENKNEWVKASLPQIKKVIKDFLDSRASHSNK